MKTVTESSIHNPRCAAQHIAPWLIESGWFTSAVAAAKSGSLRPMAQDTDAPAPRVLYTLTGNVAVINIDGAIMKGDSKYGGTSSVWTRKAIRAAMNNPEVAGIMLHIDSPGGTVAGTSELADDIRRADALKPVVVHADDLLASAAYWIATSARRIASNAAGEVGSIGVVAVVEDTSKAAEVAGIKVHVISTGEMKGAFTDGAPVTDDQLAYLQERVNSINAMFQKAVSKGRGISASKLAAISDGRVYSAARAMELGLIDAVQPFEASMADLAREIKTNSTPRRTKAEAKIRLAKNN